MSTKQDLQNPNIPKLMYHLWDRKIIPWDGIERIAWRFHHRVKQQLIKRKPELIKEQALIYLPSLICIEALEGRMGNIHSEIDARHSNLEQRWGIKLEEVLWVE